jgi:hypothetical protein
MPNPSVDPVLASIVESFTRQLIAAVESATVQRIQGAVAGALGAPVKRGPGRPPKATVFAASEAPTRRTMNLSPATMRTRKLQGQYLGALNGLSAADKTKVKQVAASKGKEQAIKLAQSLKSRK